MCDQKDDMICRSVFRISKEAMCEVNAYIFKDGKEHLMMKGVNSIAPMKDGRLYLISLSGEQKIINGSILRVVLIDHKIVLEYAYEPVANRSE